MLKQVEHVFVGEYINFAGLAGGGSFKTPYDGSDQNGIMDAYCVTPGMRNGIYYINPAKSWSEAGSAIIAAHTSDYQVGMFQYPNNVGDKRMILSPVLRPPVPANKVPAAFAPPASVPEDTFTVTNLNNAAYAAGYFLQVTFRFNNITELSPGQKYNIITVNATPNSGDKRLIDEACFTALAARINGNEYLSRFVVAKYDVATHIFTITARPKEYTAYTLTPPERISFDANLLMVENNGKAKGPVTEVSGGTAITAVMTRGGIPESDPRYVMACEKRARGYIGVTNVTMYPTNLPDLRTDLSREAYMWLYAPSIERPYMSVEGKPRASYESLRIFLGMPQGTKSADWGTAAAAMKIIWDSLFVATSTFPIPVS